MSKRNFSRVGLLATGTVAAGILASAAGTAVAAPSSYATAVLADNPYVYYRLGESSGTTAADSSTNLRDGTYVNSPTLGALGAGVGSDTAASFSSTASSYVSAPISTFGSGILTSSYEFVLKANTPNFTALQSILGVINASEAGPPARTNKEAIGIEVNSAGVNGSNTAGTARLWLRDEDGSQLWANFDMGSLLDGNYHQLAITMDGTTGSDPVASKVKVYIDGVAQTLTDGAESPALADNWLDLTVNAAINARNVRDSSLDRAADLTIDEASLYTTTLSASQVAAHAAAVPEPATLSLLGVVGMTLIGRRRKVSA